MQDISGVDDDSHIITCSNAKKLSFQGWEKCVEAFSQGKGSLSHHCSRLMSQMDSSQLDTPRLDEVISWSSSDGECDEPSNHQHIRLRPNRTLASQINFDECKPLRERGRRHHTSAQFVRSIDKRLTQESQKLEKSKLQSSSSKLQLSTLHENIDSSFVREDQSFTPCSDSFNELIWMKNLSLLNQRVNLSPSCSDSFNITNNLGTQLGVSASTEIAEVDQENRPTSPILGSHERKRHKRKMTLNSDECDFAIALDESGSKCQTPGSHSTSPIFKTSSHKKRREKKILSGSSHRFVNNLQADLTSPMITKVKVGNKVTCDNDDSEGAEKFHTAENALLVAAKGIDTSNKSPKVSKKTFQLAVSPVIKKSIRKRRKSLPKMKIDQSISPILGSKIKNVRTKRQKIIPSNCVKQRMVPDSEPTTLSEDFEESLSQQRSMVPNYSIVTSKVNLEEVTEGIEANDSNLFITQSKTAVKRSLDFSYPNKTHNSESNNFDTEFCMTRGSMNRAEQTSDHKLNVISSFNFKAPKAVYEGDAQELSNSFSHSHLIEEINTEQLTFENFERKPATTTSSKKKKTLSLSRKQESKMEKNEISSLQISKEKNPVKVPNIEKELLRKCRTPHKREVELPHKIQSLSSKRNNQQIRVPAYTKRPENLTLCIEEEFSEPLEKTSQDFVVSPLFLQNVNSGGSKRATVTAGRFADIDGQRRKKYNDMDIDSCSSQSPEESQLEKIERLPSPSPSSLSPVAISQMSSPPAPAVSSSPLEQVADDFNAPPRKGRKKLKPDGLANRLQRLLNRQRSSARIWQFKRSKQSRTSSSSTLDVLDQSTSILLIVDRTWNEYSHAVVQGHVRSDINQYPISRPNALSRSMIVILDPCVAERIGRVMLASMIRIFPPWQALKLRGTSVILGANCIEVLGLQSREHIAEEESSLTLNEGFQNVTGINLLEIIFPKVEENTSHLLQCANSEEHLNDLEGPIKQGTISKVVSNHCVGGSNSDWLTLTILRAFHFRQTDKAGEKKSSVWSLLGQDTTGELCELVLGCDELPTPDRNIWQDLKTERIMGRTYYFYGFLPFQRISPFRVSNLWSVVSSMGILGPCDQSVFYILGTSGSSWKCKPSENQRRKDIYHPFFSSLKAISSQNGLCESQRINIICQMLLATAERLYITDLDTAPSITVVSVNPAAYVPHFTSKAVVSILDVEILAEGLRADKYTRIVSIDAISTFPNNLYNAEQCRCLSDLNPELPMLHRNTPAKTLVLFYGFICGVDEDSAFMWPSCGICGNEILSVGDSSEKYCCESCNGQSENFTLRMSLQVLATCPNLPEKSSVRIKLHQSTIESLLPASLCNEEGYDMNTVLGQKIGPLKCEVLLVKNGNFTLQELS